MSRGAGGPPRGRRRDRLIAFGWLVLVWSLFWGDFSWGNLAGGMLVAGAVLLFFPLPPVRFGGRLRPGPLLVFAVRFVSELVSASAHVARVAVQPGYRPRGAIIALRLRVRTDLNLALTAEAISLVPGTLIVEVDRHAGVLYVHVFDTHGPQDLIGSRQRILAVERRLVRAVGSAAEVRQVSADPVERGP
ncbi:Na+/H+ antiporter subunit E [Micromonospora peucetia]|uniref:Multicomponent Na+:H+ antiporter subunit E n=1 Tax=Micromonospora peucetia TaxID=47871 RepID=A0A1C6U3H3_9ACTN|nr:Na+/H+ antiporter subunit E [Micromonospora peucetia]MCX4386004.1 Na+/H+ antiporter subunit E [Micromonospora peucetia]WSA33372.1 Na+/H+ antiporter subunit E [Micromonospora peucetia]SCL48564.1 multicomponent Na+:H+ antiporter subunit E [Micromonospora peucetia]